MQKELMHRSERQKQMPNKHKTEVGHFSSDQLNANKNTVILKRCELDQEIFETEKYSFD